MTTGDGGRVLTYPFSTEEKTSKKRFYIGYIVGKKRIQDLDVNLQILNSEFPD